MTEAAAERARLRYPTWAGIWLDPRNVALVLTPSDGAPEKLRLIARRRTSVGVPVSPEPGAG